MTLVNDHSQQSIRCSTDFFNIPGGISSSAYVNVLKSRPWGRYSPRKSWTCIIIGPANEPWQHSGDWNDNSSGRPSCPSLVPLSWQRSRKGINQGPNKTRFSLAGMAGRERGDGEEAKGREGWAAGVRRRGKTLIILRQTHCGRAQVYLVSNVAGWRYYPGQRTRHAREQEEQVPRRESSTKTVPLWRLWKWNCNRKRVYGAWGVHRHQLLRDLSLAAFFAIGRTVNLATVSFYGFSRRVHFYVKPSIISAIGAFDLSLANVASFDGATSTPRICHVQGDSK